MFPIFHSHCRLFFSLFWVLLLYKYLKKLFWSTYRATKTRRSIICPVFFQHLRFRPLFVMHTKWLIENGSFFSVMYGIPGGILWDTPFYYVLLFPVWQLTVTVLPKNDIPTFNHRGDYVKRWQPMTIGDGVDGVTAAATSYHISTMSSEHSMFLINQGSQQR